MAKLARAALLASALGAAAGSSACAYPEIAAGYAAKMMCSCLFVAGRDAGSCLHEELGAYESLLSVDVEPEAGAVTVSSLLVASARAEHDAALGCTLR
jgi:hypothetical protein